MNDTPAPRGEFKRRILVFCEVPRTLAWIAAEFGDKAPKCANNMALRRELVNINGWSCAGRHAVYVAKRHARQYQTGAAPAK